MQQIRQPQAQPSSISCRERWWDVLSLGTGRISMVVLGRTGGPGVDLYRQDQSNCPSYVEQGLR